MTSLDAAVAAGDEPRSAVHASAARERHLIAFHAGLCGTWRTLATVEDRSICQVLHRLAELQVDIGPGIYRIYRINRDGSRPLVFEGLRLTGADLVDDRIRKAAGLG